MKEKKEEEKKNQKESTKSGKTPESKLVLDKYKITADNIETEVTIKKSAANLSTYEVSLLPFKPATLALLEEIKQELVTKVQVTTAEILDPKAVEKLKVRFDKKAVELIKRHIPNITDQRVNYLVGRLIQDMLGLGDVEFLLNDPNLEEIVINSALEPIRIYHKKYGWLPTNIYLKNEGQIQNYSNIIARRVGRQITTLNPLLDAHLTTGDRANAVLYPISSKGNTITLRKFARDPWTITDFVSTNTITSEVSALAWLAIQYEMNILISGGTGSGKTSLLNVCMPFIPPNQRIVSIEDTRELQLPKFLYWCPLTTRQPNPEGKGEVSMLHLLINSLRMRPDRVVLGEIRKKQDAEVLFEAMHTGHSVYATVHADTTFDTIRRLINPPIEVPPNLLEAVNLNLVMFRDRRRGIRKVYQVGEYMPSGSNEQGKGSVISNLLYRWDPITDKIIKHSESTRLLEDLSRVTGMSYQEINSDLKEKQKIIDWMVKNQIRGVDKVGEVMNMYYTDPQSVMAEMKKMIGDKEKPMPKTALTPIKVKKVAVRQKPAGRIRSMPAKTDRLSEAEELSRALEKIRKKRQKVEKKPASKKQKKKVKKKIKENKKLIVKKQGRMGKIKPKKKASKKRRR